MNDLFERHGTSVTRVSNQPKGTLVLQDFDDGPSGRNG
jgi:hypothetical protein